MNDVVEIDVAKLRYRDLIDLEEVTGVAAGETVSRFESGALSAKEAAAMLWITLRLSEPGLTFDEVIDRPVVAVAGAAVPFASGPSEPST